MPMREREKSLETLRFVDFVFDGRAGELRRAGRSVRLAPQPTRVLHLLARRSGELVTREEISHEVWDGDTVVDFDRSINTCIKQIRAALEDDPDQPRFVETVPRRGYRFLPAVESATTRPGVRRAIPAALIGLASCLLLAGWWLFPDRGNPLTPPFRTLPLTTLNGEENFPAFSPDGARVAFSHRAEPSGDFNLYIGDVKGYALTQLTSGAENDLHPAWSRDGTRLAFTRGSADHTAVPGSGETRDLLWTSPLGGRVHKLATISGLGWGVSFSPDDRFLAVPHRPSSDTSRGIFAISLDTGEMERLTDPGPQKEGLPRDGNPRYSPDGRYLAFIRQAQTLDRDIFLLRMSDRRVERLTRLHRVVLDHDWTPDGRSLVFSAGADYPPYELGKISTVDGKLTWLGIQGGTVAVSPDGWRVATSYRAPRDLDVWIGPARRGDGDAPRPWIASTRSESYAEISPDGESIVFVSRRSGAPELWLCGRDGADPTQLTFLEARTYRPRWSPSGDRIAFYASVDGNWDIYVLEAAGGPPVRITRSEANDWQASWSSDGHFLYFASDRGESGFQVWRVAAAGGGAPEQMTRNGAYDAAESADGQHIYFTKQYAPGVFRLPLPDGVEESVLPHGDRNRWALVAKGIYFFDTGQRSIRFFDFDTGGVSDVLTPEHEIAWDSGGFSVTTDERWLLFPQGEGVSSVDLLLAEPAGS